MTTRALNLANRSAAAIVSFIDALGKAIAMKKASHPDNSANIDLKKIRAIADTI